MSKYHKPIVQPNENFAWVPGDVDPAVRYSLARDTAFALLDRVRAQSDPLLVEKVVSLAEKEGIDTIAELWSDAHHGSLPGTLWRLYLLRELLRKNSSHMSELYRRGLEDSETIDGVIAGAKEPINPGALLELSSEILRGAFVGDFAVALDRAAGACAILSQGATKLAGEQDIFDEQGATKLTTQALRFDTLSRELRANARAWRLGLLE